MEKLITKNIPPLENLINKFNRLPGIGPKMAERLAFYILRMASDDAHALAQAIVQARGKVGVCLSCFGISETDVCPICSSFQRDKTLLCIVEKASNISSMERARIFYGMYHVLGGLLSPLDGIGPDNLNIKQLLDRLGKNNFQEIIIATNPSVEGEATSTYLVEKLKPLGITLSRIAFGLPIGGDIEHADELTLAKAMEGRRTI